MTLVYLGLGSNLGDRKVYLQYALENINTQIGVIDTVSPVYECEAWGYKSENDFYNLVVALHTPMSPEDLISTCKAIEQAAGRKEKTLQLDYSDRPLDIDILFYDGQKINIEGLKIPHPRLAARRFVLQPMNDIASDFVDPLSGKTIQNLLADCDDRTRVEKMPFEIMFDKNSELKEKEIKPDYIFETSWEVCNQVGGIYTVLSTRAKTLQDEHPDKLLFIGPDFWKETPCPWFVEDKKLLADWVNFANVGENLHIRVGRWSIPGNPIAILIDFTPLFQKQIRHRIYERVWTLYNVSSIAAYGDYHEATSFSIASGMVIESFYRFFKLTKDQNVIAHFNEWTTSFGLFYVKHYLPSIATVFTTHATSIGRSIAGNNKPLYDYLHAYNGDQMARELNMEAKHSAEKVAAHQADCFTTVSEITGKECKQLLEKQPDIITPNGFENNFVPTGKAFDKKRKDARTALRNVAETLFGYELDRDVLFIGTCGRYEYKNKGIDAYIDALSQLSHDHLLNREIVAFIMVPAYIKGARVDLQQKLAKKDKSGLSDNYITHELHHPESDPVTSCIRWHHMDNRKESKVKIVFVPSYLNGSDGIFNKSYYDLLIGFDLTAFPSYYEPWGYTPLESIAFNIPTITTNLSGFGMWVRSLVDCKVNCLSKGAVVLDRTDYNYQELIYKIKLVFLEFSLLEDDFVMKAREAAGELSRNALWEKFIGFYKETYTFAFRAKDKRTSIN
jgi:2-amino-4-hydroxy-6-hydroxymethyldihydropteridine diphosphokinase